MAIYELDGQAPELPADGNYFIADTATVIGKVRLHSSASVWFGAMLRGDNEWIEIGENSNVQDNCTCHTDLGFRSTMGKICTFVTNFFLQGARRGDGLWSGLAPFSRTAARSVGGTSLAPGAWFREGRRF